LEKCECSKGVDSEMFTDDFGVEGLDTFPVVGDAGVGNDDVEVVGGFGNFVGGSFGVFYDFETERDYVNIGMLSYDTFEAAEFGGVSNRGK